MQVISLARECAKLRMKINLIHCFIEKMREQNNGINGIKERGKNGMNM
jgi:hypothetical protein